MAASEAQRRASAKYDAENTKQVKMKLNLTSDQDVLTRLNEESNLQGYIKELIRRDIKSRYQLYWTGGDKDGFLIKTFDDEWEALRFGNKYYSEHEDEFDPVCGGLWIQAPDGSTVEWT